MHAVVENLVGPRTRVVRGGRLEVNEVEVSRVEERQRVAPWRGEAGHISFVSA